ncbi:ankyrin, partial [Lepidopterella palustris CBS 459.81]
AAENGHVDVVLLLLQKGVDIDLQKKKHRHTALHLAALNGHSGVVKTLLQEGARANLQDDEGWNALHMAAWTGKKGVVDVLLDQMDVHERGKDGITALHCAAGQGQRAVAELLINRGANVNTKDTYGWTALHWASKKRHDLAKLRQLEFKDDAKLTALHCAVPGGTALHVAVGLRKEKVAQVLIQNGADVGAKTRDGRTALQWA